jgi:hypothetical protein
VLSTKGVDPCSCTPTKERSIYLQAEAPSSLVHARAQLWQPERIESTQQQPNDIASTNDLEGRMYRMVLQTTVVRPPAMPHASWIWQRSTTHTHELSQRFFFDFQTFSSRRTKGVSLLIVKPILMPNYSSYPLDNDRRDTNRYPSGELTTFTPNWRALQRRHSAGVQHRVVHDLPMCEQNKVAHRAE